MRLFTDRRLLLPLVLCISTVVNAVPAVPGSSTDASNQGSQVPAVDDDGFERIDFQSGDGSSNPSRSNTEKFEGDPLRKPSIGTFSKPTIKKSLTGTTMDPIGIKDDLAISGDHTYDLEAGEPVKKAGTVGKAVNACTSWVAGKCKPATDFVKRQWQKQTPYETYLRPDLATHMIAPAFAVETGIIAAAARAPASFTTASALAFPPLAFIGQTNFGGRQALQVAHAQGELHDSLLSAPGGFKTQVNDIHDEVYKEMEMSGNTCPHPWCRKQVKVDAIDNYMRTANPWNRRGEKDNPGQAYAPERASNAAHINTMNKTTRYGPIGKFYKSQNNYHMKAVGKTVEQHEAFMASAVKDSEIAQDNQAVRAYDLGYKRFRPAYDANPVEVSEDVKATVAHFRNSGLERKGAVAYPADAIERRTARAKGRRLSDVTDSSVATSWGGWDDPRHHPPHPGGPDEKFEEIKANEGKRPEPDRAARERMFDKSSAEYQQALATNPHRKVEGWLYERTRKEKAAALGPKGTRPPLTIDMSGAKGTSNTPSPSPDGSSSPETFRKRPTGSSFYAPGSGEYTSVTSRTPHSSRYTPITSSSPTESESGFHSGHFTGLPPDLYPSPERKPTVRFDDKLEKPGALPGTGPTKPALKRSDAPGSGGFQQAIDARVEHRPTGITISGSGATSPTFRPLQVHPPSPPQKPQKKLSTESFDEDFPKLGTSSSDVAMKRLGPLSTSVARRGTLEGQSAAEAKDKGLVSTSRDQPPSAAARPQTATSPVAPLTKSTGPSAPLSSDKSTRQSSDGEKKTASSSSGPERSSAATGPAQSPTSPIVPPAKTTRLFPSLFGSKTDGQSSSSRFTRSSAASSSTPTAHPPLSPSNLLNLQPVEHSPLFSPTERETTFGRSTPSPPPPPLSLATAGHSTAVTTPRSPTLQPVLSPVKATSSTAPPAGSTVKATSPAINPIETRASPTTSTTVPPVSPVKASSSTALPAASTVKTTGSTSPTVKPTQPVAKPKVEVKPHIV